MRLDNQIWQELNGAYIFELVTGEHETYHTIQKVKTFTPPSSDRDVVFAQLVIFHIEQRGFRHIMWRKHVVKLSQSLSSLGQLPPRDA